MRLGAFKGAWRLDRRIEDVRSGMSGCFRGRAAFVAGPGGLDYAEAGLLRLGTGPACRAARRYLWRDGGANMIEVLFADGRFFHRFYADEVMPAAVHDCLPDRYRVRYDFRRWPVWQAEWRVQGPRKDYVTLTTFRPD